MRTWCRCRLRPSARVSWRITGNTEIGLAQSASGAFGPGPLATLRALFRISVWQFRNLRSSEGTNPQSLLAFSTRFERNAPPVPRSNASGYWNTSVTTNGKPLNPPPGSANQRSPAMNFDRPRCDPYSFNKKQHRSSQTGCSRPEYNFYRLTDARSNCGRSCRRRKHETSGQSCSCDGFCQRTWAGCRTKICPGRRGRCRSGYRRAGRRCRCSELEAGGVGGLLRCDGHIR